MKNFKYINGKANTFSSLSCQKGIGHDTSKLKEQAIILGSLLGDGSLKIHSGYKNARFSFRHSYKQQEYFM